MNLHRTFIPIVLVVLAAFTAITTGPSSVFAQTAASSSDSTTLDDSQFDIAQGYFDFYWDDEEGKVWLHMNRLDEPFLYVSSLATGLGSNPVGLDRGQLGSDRIVRFKRVGQQVYLVQQNLKYRAGSQNESEKRAVMDSFADSILWSGNIQPTKSGKKVVDLTSFLLRDAHDCVGRLSSTGQGKYSLHKGLSYVHMERTRAFPENTEFESALTFTSSDPGSLAQRAAADGRYLTLRQHHSFVKLPEPGYRPRVFDPRVGSFSVDFADYSVPIDEPIQQRLITRHRLEKIDPKATSSAPKEPIVYYVDPGVPQPVRDALVEGASWWDDAFRSAGFESAFQVRILPEDADPMDVRYNVIQWVHRATRGWSYGQSVIDPRTGEIIKGHVLLGSLRVRQDNLLFDGLLPTPPEVNNSSCGLGFSPDASYLTSFADPRTSSDVSLARIRQLAAHEVGHTLGFSHNFAASTFDDRASVMDYPAPRVGIDDESLDLSDAYGVGIGSWDKFTVQYAYSQFTPEVETEELSRLVSKSLADGMLYITDADARPAGASHPLANLWDNGSDPVAALEQTLAVRKIAMDAFSKESLAKGRPLSELERIFVPVYLHHRYQTEAAAKMLGGYVYTYAVNGDGQTPITEVAAAEQKRALRTLLKTLSPQALAIATDILNVLPPKVSSSANDRERFDSGTAPVFDATQAMRGAADLTLSNVLQPQRANRLASCKQPGWNLQNVLSTLTDQLYRDPPADPTSSEAHRIVESVYALRLMDLAASASASSDTKALSTLELQKLTQLRYSRQNELYAAHRSLLNQRITRFLERPHSPAKTPAQPTIPPGSPIGGS